MTTRKEKKKRAMRNLTRRQRRKEYKTLMVTFLLAGGHKDYIPPFSHNWKQILSFQITQIENGIDFYTKPRNNHGIEHTSFITTPLVYSKSIVDILNSVRHQGV